MSSNSANKPIVSRTPPNVSGQAKVDLRKNDFDAAVWLKGYDVYIDKAIKCPCAVKSNNGALSSCKNCGGSGYVFINRYQTKLLLQSMNIDTRYKEWSQEKLGTVRITARTEDELTYMDRVTLLTGLMSTTQTIHPFTKGNQIKGRATHPPVEIEEVFCFVDGSEELRKLNYGTDVSITGIDFSVENNILTFSSEFLAWEHFSVTIRYKHYPTYHIIDLPRGVMETEALNKTNGRNEYTKMPIHAIGRLAHYVLDEQNLNEDFLLDNSYDVACVSNANIQILSNRACPDKSKTAPSPVNAGFAIVENSDKTYRESVKSGKTLVLPDVTHTDSDGSSVSLPGLTPMTCTPSLPATQIIRDAGGNVLYNNSINSGDTENQEIADSTVSNSDNSYTESILAEESLALPDVNITLNGGSVIKASPSAIDINIEVEDDAGNTGIGTVTGNKVIVPAGSTGTILYNMPQPEWDVSYNTYDEGWHNINGTYSNIITSGAQMQARDNNDFYKVQLDKENRGHLYRFLGLNGGYYNSDTDTYHLDDDTLSDRATVIDNDDYVFDRLTGLGWRTRRGGSASYTVGLADIPLSTFNGLGGWYMPFLDQWLSIINTTLQFPTYALNSPVFDIQLTGKICTPHPPNPTGSACQTSTGGTYNRNRVHSSADVRIYVRDARGQF
jgi:hypothetical protein